MLDDKRKVNPPSFLSMRPVLDSLTLEHTLRPNVCTTCNVYLRLLGSTSGQAKHRFERDFMEIIRSLALPPPAQTQTKNPLFLKKTCIWIFFFYKSFLSDWFDDFFFYYYFVSSLLFFVIIFEAFPMFRGVNSLF